MLSLDKVVFGREGYYLDVTASGRDSGLIEPDGAWLGRLGPSGPAEPGDVRRYLSQADPETGEVAGGLARRQIAAYDCTFSAPKSVSVLHALAEPAVTAAVRAAHESAVAAALGYLEMHATAVRIWGVEGGRVVDAEGMVAVGFVHRSSRAPDPHLHTHVLIANLVPDPERGPRPLDARPLYLERRATGALYECHLRAELSVRLGVEFGDMRGVYADLEGFTPQQLAEFSRRSAQIDAVVAALGWQGPDARRVVARDTRPPKDLTVSYEECVYGWRQRAFEVGLSPAAVAAVVGRGVPTHDQRWEDEVVRHLTDTVVDGSLGRRDLIVARCSVARSGLDVAGVERDVGAMLSTSRILVTGESMVRLGGTTRPPSGRTEARYTTPAIRAAEDRVAGLASELGEGITFVGYGAGERPEALSALSESACAWDLAERRVVGLAPSRWAAKSFEGVTGIETVVRFASDRSAVPALRAGSVVVLAEASCYGPAALGDIMQSCQSSGVSLVMLASSYGLDTPVGRIAHLAAGRLPESPGEPMTGATLKASFGGVEVVGLRSFAAALEHVAELGVMSGKDRRTILVTGDASLVTPLRERTGGAVPVVQAGGLSAALEKAAGENAPVEHVVVLGGASMLRKQLKGIERTHVVVTPAMGRGIDGEIGRLAEAARPGYMIAVLGRTKEDLDGRQTWREGAVVLEGFRDRWSITDAKRAFGPETKGVLPLETALELASDRNDVDRQLRSLRLGRGVDRASGMGLGL